MTYSFTPSQERAVAAMKALGFTHAKIELEAQLNRQDNYSACGNCDEGYLECSTCYGSGVIETTAEAGNGRTLDITAVCDDCDGDGQITCSSCDGDWEGSGSDWSDESDCERFIYERVSTEARQALSFYRFYDDGSVDSEFTFTLPLSDLPYAVEFLDAFKALAEQIGGGLETQGAGMHLSVLTSSSYPTRQPLDRRRIANFKTEVAKLLPALYFVASPDHASRGLNFRQPKISPEKHGDYPAICTHDDTSLEYRIFETCYQRPEALLEDYEVIANTLKYYSARKLKLPTPHFRFYADGQGLSRFYDTSEKLRALNAGLPFIKPNKPVSALKAERNFKLTVKELKMKERIKEREHEAGYQAWLAEQRRVNQERLDRLTHDRDDIRQRIQRGEFDPERVSRDDTLMFFASPLADDSNGLRAYLADQGRWREESTLAEYLHAQVSSGRGYAFN